MKFEGDIENSFAKAIRSHDFSVNRQALKFATSYTAQGSEIEFQKIIEENEISERLEDVISFAPISDYANFDLHQGGEKSYNRFIEVLMAKPREVGNEGYIGGAERWVVMTDLDSYMSNIEGVAGNRIARSEINISKTQYEMYQKMLEADDFDISIALSIHKTSAVLDDLSPEYVKHHMNLEDVKAIVSTLDDTINEDLVYGDLSYEVGRFVKTCRLTTRKPHVLFSVMTTFANATANGETEEEVLKSLREIGLVEDKIIDKYVVVLEQEKAKAKALAEDEEQKTELPETKYFSLIERLEGLNQEEKEYFKQELESGNIDEGEKEYVARMLEMPSVTDEELEFMDEFDRMYDEDIEGSKKKRFGFGR